MTYIINVRGGGSSSGYVSSGFFGGLTLGRVGLLWVNQKVSFARPPLYVILTWYNKVGERRAIFLYTVIAIGCVLSLSYQKQRQSTA